MQTTTIKNPLFTFLTFFLLFFTGMPSYDVHGADNPQELYTKTEEINGYRVTRGIRPSMHFSTADTAAWHPGTLIIKFKQELTRHLEKHPPTVDKNGVVSFHMEQTDSLNKFYGAVSVTQYFLSPALGNSFSERHKAWGFHLWYKLQVHPGSDVLAMIHDYQNLPEIETAVPAFRKVHHGKQSDAHNPRPSNYDSQVDADDNRPDVVKTLMQPHCNKSGLNNGSFNERFRSEETGWTPNDTFFGSQWSLQNTGQHQGTPGADISMPGAWEIETGHPAVIVAVIDDGIDYNHEDLAGNMWHLTGYNFTNNSNNIIPGNHGCVVAGVVAAVSGNNTGVAGIAGGSGNNDGARLMSLQVFSEGGNHGFHIAPIFAADNGAAISQNSWGYSTPGYYNPGILDAIDYFNEYGGGDVLEGGITITSAGNSNSDEPFYPAFYPGVMSVTATNNQDKKAWYSNFGDYHDIAAPGGETNDLAPRGILNARVNNSYGFSQGTSLSCPHVSGVAALLISYAYRNNHILTNSQVWDFLVDNADDINEYNPEYHDLLGSGRLNAFKVLQAAINSLGIIPAPNNLMAQAIDDRQTQVEWTPNLENHQVMLVFSQEDAFGSPVSGTFYEPGDNIPGGGTVIYRGPETSFTHAGLQENTVYHYKAFSYNDDYRYSIGRKTAARTLGPNLVITGLYEDYHSIPLSQLPQSIELKARVQNTGLRLNTQTGIDFSVHEANYSGSGQLTPPLEPGDEIVVYAEPPWPTSSLKRGSYTMQFEAGLEVSAEENRKDSITIHITDSLYGRDNHNIVNGIGSNSGPVILGVKYEIHRPAAVTAIQMQWPDLLISRLDFRLALYEVDDDNVIIRQVIVSDLFTRMPDMRNQAYNFVFKRPVILTPGNYMLAFKQLTSVNLTVGIDDAENGYFYRSNISADPVSFPHKHDEFGNLAMRMILYEADMPTNIDQPEDIELPKVWYHNNVIYVNNPLEYLQMVLYDINGRTLRRFSPGSGATSYPVSLPRGAYILNFENISGLQPVKIIVQ